MIESILINTYNADPALRIQAETSLNEILSQHNALSSFIHFIGDRNNHRDLRLAAAIAIKNKARSFWRDDKVPPDSFTISEEEKGYVRQIIIDVLLSETDNSIRGLLSDSMKVYAEYDYPERWPNLLPTLLTCITSHGNLLHMYNGLVALRKLVKKFEYKNKEQRIPLEDIIHATFKHLLHIASIIFADKNMSIEAAQIIKTILKIFWSSMMYQLPISSQGLDVHAWFQLLGFVLDLDISSLEGDRDSLTLHPWWKTKKWSSRVCCQFIQRYGNPRYAGEEYTAFSNYFKNTVANQLLTPIMNVLAKKTQGVFITDFVHRCCLTYVASAIEMSPSYKVVKPHLDFLLFNVIFPTLCVTPDDIILFDEDPQEFVRKIVNSSEDWLDPRLAAITLLQVLARYRQKDTLPLFMPFLTNMLVEYNANPKDQMACIKKDGVIVAVATIQKILHDSPSYAAQLEPFLMGHIVPEFQNPVAFLRARACWAIEYMDADLWEEERILNAVLGGLLQNLRDPALPVQAAAACSMRVLIDQDGSIELLRPMLTEIVGEYFRIMDDLESDTVLSALQALVYKFGEEIQGIAPLMVEKLIVNFDTFNSQQSDDDDEAAFSAGQCLDTVGAVIEALEAVPPAVSVLEPLVVPLLVRILENADELGYDYVDNAVQILGLLTYINDDVSLPLWTVCGPLLIAVSTWASDYIIEIAAPLLNYISKSSDLFVQSSFNDGRPFTIVLIELVQAVTSRGTGYDRESRVAMGLLTCLVTCAKGKINEYIPKILEVTLERLQNPFKLAGCKYAVLETALAVIYYDPVFSMNALRGANEAPSKLLFSSLFDALPHMEKNATQRLIVMAFSSMLTLPAAILPALVSSNLDAMFRQMIRELVLIEEEAGKEEDGEEEEGEGDDDEGETSSPFEDAGKWGRLRASMEVPEGGFGEDEDCLNAEDEMYREAIEKLGKEERVKRQLYIDGEPVDDDEEDEDEFEYTSPIENMDVLDFFVSAMQAVHARDSPLMARLQAALEQEDTDRLQELLATNSKRRTERLQTQQ